MPTVNHFCTVFVPGAFADLGQLGSYKNVQLVEEENGRDAAAGRTRDHATCWDDAVS